MKKQSAGLLLYRTTGENTIEVLLVHPGGPFWARKDMGAWSIPKGEFAEEEMPEAAARREFAEELGIAAPEGPLLDLGQVKQPGGKVVYAWAIAGDLDTKQVKSNSFTMEWPPRSGKQQEFPEVDKARWFTMAAASQKIGKGQLPLLEHLAAVLGLDAAVLTADPAEEQDTKPGEDTQTSLF
jgi:predicted NUDIX family NTP pyrophosphohydrolase